MSKKEAREVGDFGPNHGQTTSFPPIIDRDGELKTTVSKPVNPAKESDSPMSTPAG